MNAAHASDAYTSVASTPTGHGLALALHGGGARAAYQVGFLRGLSRIVPDLQVPFLTGVSAGAINASYLASHACPFDEAVSGLCDLWSNLEIEQVFRVDNRSLFSHMARWGWRLLSGGGASAPAVRGLLDTSPLRELLCGQMAPEGGAISGIATSLEKGCLKAVAITTSSYTTGRSVTWVQGSDIQTWERPDRSSRNTRLTVDHVMASAALPMFFPAVHLDDGWYGDGAVRMVAPLAPAVHLGASKILTISTRHRNPRGVVPSEDLPHPPPMQIAGQLLNAVFLDVLDQDAMRLARLNGLLNRLPEHERDGLRPVNLMIVRPSQDLSALAGEFEPRLPWLFRHLTRGMGADDSGSPDVLSFLMFQPEYLRRLMELGEADANAHAEEVRLFLQR